jgi:hypothetical protein
MRRGQTWKSAMRTRRGVCNFTFSELLSKQYIIIFHFLNIELNPIVDQRFFLLSLY